jgi:hypothetical protein
MPIYPPSKKENDESAAIITATATRTVALHIKRSRFLTMQITAQATISAINMPPTMSFTAPGTKNPPTAQSINIPQKRANGLFLKISISADYLIRIFFVNSLNSVIV